jgi:hypothetical protein
VTGLQGGEVKATNLLTGSESVRSFDFVVGADGAGSKMRTSMQQQGGESGFSIRKIELDNWSQMLAFDRREAVAADLDPSVRSLGVEQYHLRLPVLHAYIFNFALTNTIAAPLQVLYGMRIKPLCVAGAINGECGADDPVWFCQVAYKGRETADKIRAMSIPQLRRYIGSRVGKYCSDDALQQFKTQEPQVTIAACMHCEFYISQLSRLFEASAIM